MSDGMLHESSQSPQCGSSFGNKDDLHEDHREVSQKTTSEIKKLDCKNALVEERLVVAQADLERKVREIGLLREYLSERIKELQADMHKWHAKYADARKIIDSNQIPLDDSEA
ncbi:hypothetical protein TorRG33x02_250170 [Trema orientale]|uniref:Uncharacterized protein n=1 Tax=Trema orientale TaxID=63057 RepID=A0A2P5DJ11_TREOI|nr:hypothetical protein TorRG33x02_250170 [Trema orientale]